MNQSTSRPNDHDINKMPAGIPYIMGNELAERFSYYGMKAILVIFMTKYLMDSNGSLAVMDETEAKTWFHLFSAANYFFPILGAVISDIFWGKYKTIINLSIVYCLGHLCLALFETRFGLATGLTLIAIGSGGIKPCVSANVGDQFTERNKHLIEKVFSFFYFAINFGAFTSSLLTPVLLNFYGPSVAFGVPGLLMFIATVIFWAGQKKFVTVPPAGWKAYKKEVLSPQGLKAIYSLSIIYLFVAVFWALFDQGGSAWVLQADKLDRFIDLSFGIESLSWLKFTLLPSQIQAVNPILVLLFIPIFTFAVYPLMGKFFKVTALRKISIGLFLAALPFALVAWIEQQLAAGLVPSVLWQFLAYALLTAAEIMVSITALEFSYTQAPNNMKSLLMGVFLLSISLGNVITAGVNVFIRNDDESLKLQGAEYFWFFSIFMFVAASLFIIVAKLYKEECYIQSHG